MTTRLVHVLRAIDRPVFRVVDGGEVDPVSASQTLKRRPVPLLEAEFYAMLEAREAGAGERLRKFVERLLPLGVRADVVRTLTLRGEISDQASLSLCSISTAGEVQIYPATPSVLALPGGPEAVQFYLDGIARLAGGEIAPGGTANGALTNQRILKDGRYPRVADLLDHANGWLEVIRACLDRLRG
ncbi:hypothetical protein [Falsiroseomonas oryzae]|uniref:hypothetical protein n=1 Tax=Falsiroseomonas oryzae TaxID=2766473 RepID=UPI0022EAA34B|nr:hypothetical protein [Roseomonas sp. MO-31]